MGPLIGSLNMLKLVGNRLICGDLFDITMVTRSQGHMRYLTLAQIREEAPGGDRVLLLECKPRGGHTGGTQSLPRGAHASQSPQGGYHVPLLMLYILSWLRLANT